MMADAAISFLPDPLWSLERSDIRGTNLLDRHATYLENLG